MTVKYQNLSILQQAAISAIVACPEEELVPAVTRLYRNHETISLIAGRDAADRQLKETIVEFERLYELRLESAKLLDAVFNASKSSWSVA